MWNFLIYKLKIQRCWLKKDRKIDLFDPHRIFLLKRGFGILEVLWCDPEDGLSRKARIWRLFQEISRPIPFLIHLAAKWEEFEEE